MRAKTINEISHFERGKEPKNVMGTGHEAEVRRMLSEIYDKETGGLHIYNYKINSLDNIEIRIDPEILIAKESYWWIIKFVQKPKYFLKEYDNTHTLFNHEFRDHDWNIYENVPFFPDQPGKYWGDEYVLTIGKHGDKKVLEMAGVILEALNKKYGLVDGFEIVKSYKEK